MDVVTLQLAKKHTEETAAGIGAVKGAPCQIQSIEKVEGGHNVAFLWQDNAGAQRKQTMFVADGRDGKDGTDGEDGKVGPQGPPGENAVAAINPRGDYSDTETYSKNDYVTYSDGNAYVCKTEDTPQGTPPTTGLADDPCWQLLALRGAPGIQGPPGNNGKDGTNGDNGAPGKSAYELAVENGEYTGDLTGWLASLKGQKGDKGDKGDKGEQGDPGPGVPDGGQPGQTLVKTGEEDYAAGWKNPHSLFDSFASELENRAVMHRMIFRGKNLGSSLTQAQKDAIQSGTFDDLYVGDYWVIPYNGKNITWRIVDIDYWMHCGDWDSNVASARPFKKHHLVIMPDTTLGGTKKMNDEATTNGGYLGSLMRRAKKDGDPDGFRNNMQDAVDICTSAFGDNILSHREYLVNSSTNGKPDGIAWIDSTIEIPNEIMILGHPHFAPACNAEVIPPHLYSIDKTQLALFALAPKFIIEKYRNNYWLRDVITPSSFAFVMAFGYAAYMIAISEDIGVRPVFPVGVE